MGKKPLYYFEQNGSLYFASEIKSLLTIPGFQRRINLEALDAYLSYKHIPHPFSIFEGVYSLPPAHKLIFRQGEPVQISRYWSPQFVEDSERSAQSEDELVQGLLELLKRGVEKRLMSDVPVGFFLSGGIDSSLSTALAAENSSQPIKTFTLTYGEKATTDGKEQDRKWSRWVAQKYKTEHHEESLEVKDFPENIIKILSCFDEPFCGTTSTYFLSSLIAKHVKVAVSGDGADELFGSYLSHRLASPIANLKKFDETGDLDLIRPFEKDLSYLHKIAENTQPDWRKKLFVFSEAEKKSLLNSSLDTSGFKSISQKLKLEFAKLQSTEPLNRILEWEFNSFLPDQVLTYVDRLSMAHSLEVRSVFLDTDVVNYVTPLSSDHKIRNGETKYLLKKAALKYFPEEMVFRGKEGFVLPVNRWVYDSMEKYARDTLSKSNLNRHGLFDGDAVSNLIDQLYKSEKQPHHTEINKLLSLIMFQEWYGLYMS
ncbi:MAG: asparagine synthase (glutamine-hydrolyzing) [Leptolyngbya sp.]|nr:asparagine synthase (glutamine-hydrolyzing) [Candidatus Melainabacteria bacterium]